jgi:hypothetical protein
MSCLKIRAAIGKEMRSQVAAFPAPHKLYLACTASLMDYPWKLEGSVDIFLPA